MKKVFVALMAVVAMTLAACSSKPESTSTSLGDPQAELPENASDLNSVLDSQLKAGNAEGFTGMLMAIPEKVAEMFKADPKQALGYVEKAQNFINENKAAITGLIGKLGDSDLAKRATELVNTLSSQSPSDYFAGMGFQLPDELKEQADELMDKLPDGIQDAVGGLLGN